jgi:DNA polymerase-4
MAVGAADVGRRESTQRLPASAAHDDDLRVPAYRLMGAVGLRRGRLTGLFLQSEDRGKSLLRDAGPLCRRSW